MARSKEGYVGLLVKVPKEMHEQLGRLAGSNDRTLEAEALAALRRHLAQPPKVVVIVEEPDLAEEVVRRKKEPTKRPGPKPKKSG